MNPVDEEWRVFNPLVVLVGVQLWSGGRQNGIQDQLFQAFNGYWFLGYWYDGGWFPEIQK